MVRAEVAGRGPDRVGADPVGADLRGADLGWADLLGADLRAADVRAARLEGCLFLTQPQLDAAVGDASTAIPSSLARPGHWPTSPTPAARGATHGP